MLRATIALMMRISFVHRRMKLLVFLSSGAVIGAILFVLLNLSASLSPGEAEQKVRLILSRELTQSYLADLANKHAGDSESDIAERLNKRLIQLRNLEFVAIDVKQLIPSILLTPHRPSQIARVVLRDESQQYPPRYFWLTWADVDSETSIIAWFFSI